ncbi:ferritin-like domain-containing protein [Chytriomyces sp. MP71]|nr:ferritin-like domain-containing protein [Chytriomyces sp. MP71]
MASFISLVSLATIAAAVPVPAPQNDANSNTTGNAIPAPAAAAAAAPAAAAPAQIDLTVLNFALTLEHLEDTFYKQALSKFGPSDFESIGLPGNFINSQFQTVASDEAIHVNFLQSAIQSTFGMNMAVPACTYNFDTALANVQNFITFASILERTGVQAYDGGLHLVQSNDIKTAAATIATVEGRHSSFLNLLTNSGPAPGPFETALGIRPVISIAAGLIKQCPFTLPAMPFPALTTVSGVGSTAIQPVQAGSVIPLMFDAGAGAAMGMGNMGMTGAEVAAGPTMLDATLPTVDASTAGPVDGSSMNADAAAASTTDAILPVADGAATDATMSATDGAGVSMMRRQNGGLQCNWVFGLTQKRTAMQLTQGGGSCTVPQDIEQAQFSQAVLFVVNQDRDVSLDDDKNVVAGPATIFVGGPNSVSSGAGSSVVGGGTSNLIASDGSSLGPNVDIGSSIGSVGTVGGEVVLVGRDSKISGSSAIMVCNLLVVVAFALYM